VIWNFKILAAAGIAIAISHVGVAWYAHSKGTQSGMSQVQTLWDAERAATQAAQAEELMKAAQKERALQALIAKQRKEHQREADRLSVLYMSALDRLSDRPDRPHTDSGSVPEDARVGTVPADGCTGAELFRPDAEFLVREASRADQLRLALQACIGAYDAAKREINGE
jgi:hypothetical protein